MFLILIIIRIEFNREYAIRYMSVPCVTQPNINRLGIVGFVPD